MSIKNYATMALLAWLTFSTHEVQAFYNPQTGRWLSRDPIGERGGQNLQGFVANDPVKKVDRLGMEILCYYDANGVWTCRSPLEGCCNGRTYLYATHCCCKGKIVAKEPIDTGVVKHKWSANPEGPGKVHVWLTWDGGSADSNGDDLPVGPGSQKVASPAQATPGPSTATPLKLSPCEYDFKKLNACLTRKAGQLNGTWGGDCRDFANKLFEDCKAESKGCTLPP